MKREKENKKGGDKRSLHTKEEHYLNSIKHNSIVYYVDGLADVSEGSFRGWVEDRKGVRGLIFRHGQYVRVAPNRIFMSHKEAERCALKEEIKLNLKKIAMCYALNKFVSS